MYCNEEREGNEQDRDFPVLLPFPRNQGLRPICGLIPGDSGVRGALTWIYGVIHGPELSKVLG